MSEPIFEPAQLPKDSHAVVVILETNNLPPPEKLDLPGGRTYEMLTYHNIHKAEDVRARVQCASVVVVIRCVLDAKALGEAPFLKCIIAQTTGVDNIDLDECRRRGIRVLNTRGVTKEVVAEHALTLYFATRRKIPTLHHALYDYTDDRPNDYKTRGSLAPLMRSSDGQAPRTCANEVVGLIGYGVIGQQIAKVCRALGMKVLVAARKGASDAAKAQRTKADTVADEEPRVPFQDALRQATLVILALPYSPTSHNLLSAREFELMHPETVIVNISRGGIVDEPALLTALKDGKIHGYGSDVFVTEPAGSPADSPLLSREAQHLNLTLTPHIAWNGDLTLRNIQQACAQNIIDFFAGVETENTVL